MYACEYTSQIDSFYSTKIVETSEPSQPQQNKKKPRRTKAMNQN